MQSGRAGIRFHSDERYGVLYCGATTDVGQMTAGRYPHLKMEDKGGYDHFITRFIAMYIDFRKSSIEQTYIFSNFRHIFSIKY